MELTLKAEIDMQKLNFIKPLSSLILISSLFSAELSAELLNGSHWLIQPGDSLYKIARNIFPDNKQQRVQLRKQLVEINPQVFNNGSNNISVGDKLQLPAFAIKQKTPLAPIIVEEIVTASEPEIAKAVTPDPEDIIGQVIINIGELRAENRGTWRSLNRRSPIYRGDTISTGGRSLSQIRLKDGALLSLRPHTDIRIAEYNYNGQQDGSEKSILELLKGGFRTITGAIGHLNKKNYRIKTSIATIGIRGTHYSLVLCQQASCSGDDIGDVEDGLYGGVSDGSIIIENQTGVHKFNNDQFFKLTSATTKPVEYLFPPAILKHGAAAIDKNNKKKNQQPAKQNISKKIKSPPRRLAVIFEANQPDFRRRPKTPVGDLNTPPVSDFQPDKAPIGSGMLIGFNQVDSAGATTGVAASVVITPNNNNLIFLGPNRTPIAAQESSLDQGVLVNHQLTLVTPNGALATLVPSSLGGDPILGVNWGRWNGNFTVLENGSPISAKDNLHYIYSENLTTPTQLSDLVQAANLGGINGSVFYGMVDGTLATDSNGIVAAGPASIFMDVDFINAQVTQYDVTTQVGANIYSAGASNIPFGQLISGFGINSGANSSCSTGPCSGDASVLFIGNQAQGAITSYQIEEADGSIAITGTGLLIPNALTVQ